MTSQLAIFYAAFIIACIFQLTVDSLSFFIRIVIYVEDYIGEVSDDDVVKRVIDVACEINP